MPRQNFLSKDSFVDATEKRAKETLLIIPDFIANIKFVGENKVLESIKFTYDQPIKKLQFYIDVSVLPLNQQFTRISLHASRANGKVFNNADMALALHDFESAIHAALKGEIMDYKPYEPKKTNSQKLADFFTTFKSSIGVMFLRKKLS
jgi:predicted P-loop ATPase/GTPase